MITTGLKQSNQAISPKWSRDVIWGKQICVDLDGVVCEYDFPKLVRGFFGIDLPAQAIFAYDLADVLGVAPTLINLMFKEQVWGKPNFVTGAIETLSEFKSRGCGISIFSNRVKYMGFDGLCKWLDNWQIPYSWLTEGQGFYDVHIDDSPSKLMMTNSGLKLLFDRPWNRGCLNVTGKLRRVFNWNDIRQELL